MDSEKAIMKTLNVALVGAGTIGRMHARHLWRAIDGARLHGVADVFADGAKACAEQNGGVRWTTDYNELLADPAVDAVVVASATATHPDIVEAAAKAGKAIFSEKPIAKSIADGERALGAVERAGVPFQIGFQRRFDPNFARIKQAIVSGEIGKPHIAHLISRDPGPPYVGPVGLGGGIWFDMAIHDLDMARWLMDDEAVEIYTQAGVMIAPGLEKFGEVDVAVMVLRFANGGVVTIDNHTDSAYGYDQRAEVIGSKGAISIDNTYPNNAVLSNAAGLHHSVPLPYFLDRYQAVYRDEIQVFVNCLLQNTPMQVGVKDARASLALAVAAKQSHEEKRPIKLG